MHKFIFLGALMLTALMVWPKVGMVYKTNFIKFYLQLELILLIVENIIAVKYGKQKIYGKLSYV